MDPELNLLQGTLMTVHAMHPAIPSNGARPDIAVALNYRMPLEFRSIPDPLVLITQLQHAAVTTSPPAGVQQTGGSVVEENSGTSIFDLALLFAKRGVGAHLEVPKGGRML